MGIDAPPVDHAVAFPVGNFVGWRFGQEQGLLLSIRPTGILRNAYIK
jgi:hypothetical protein